MSTTQSCLLKFRRASTALRISDTRHRRPMRRKWNSTNREAAAGIAAATTAVAASVIFSDSYRDTQQRCTKKQLQGKQQQDQCQQPIHYQSSIPYTNPLLSLLVSPIIAISTTMTIPKTKCDSSVTTTTTNTIPSSQPSTSFQVMAALDAKDEVQRIRMAQILHDLHELAQIYGGAVQRQGTVGRLYKYVRRITRRHSNAESRLKLIAKEEEKERKSISNRGRQRTTCRAVATTCVAPSSSRKSKSASHPKDGIDDVPLVHMYEFNEQTPLSPEEAQLMIQELANGNKFHFECLSSLLETAPAILKKENTLIDLKERSEKRVIVVGDLHGSFSSLHHVLDLVGPLGQDNDNGGGKIVIFNGDFVDRGSESLEVMGVLLILKLAYPRHVYLLRGNHEDELVASAYGFREEVISKYGNSNDLWNGFATVFSSLPIAAVTKSAAVWHGGIPTQDFCLQDLRDITSDERCAVRTLVETKTPKAQLIQGLLWSDPSTTKGIRFNTTRTVGAFFGPDVASEFLKREGLTYLIRSHEVAEEGANLMDCGDGRSVVTIFSHSEYPNGEGTNLGALIQLNQQNDVDDESTDGGNYELIRFSRNTLFRGQAMEESNSNNNHLLHGDPYVDALKSLISSNKNKLHKAFDEVAPCGTATLQQYADIMARVLEMPEVPWVVLLSSLMPNRKVNSNHKMDWRSFLALYKPSVSAATTKTATVTCRETNIGLEIMHANHQMLMTVFKFLDFDGDGIIAREEFITGITLLNKRLPADRQLQDPAMLFDRMDLDKSGFLEFDEFEDMFKVM